MKPPTHYEILAAARAFRAGGSGPKSTLMVLAERLGEHDPEVWSCWPSQESIAEDTEQDVRTVRRHLARFVEAGLFAKERRSSPEGRRSDFYVLNLAALAVGTLTQPDTVSGSATGHEAHPNRTSEGGQPAPGVRLLPISKEPSEEPSEADEAVASFAHFWEAYPKRDGKRIGKAEALAFWRKMPYDDRKAAWRGACNLSRAVAAGGRHGIKDPIRFLRHRAFDDWQEPAPAGTSRPNVTDRTAANVAAAVAVFNGSSR